MLADQVAMDDAATCAAAKASEICAVYCQRLGKTMPPVGNHLGSSVRPGTNSITMLSSPHPENGRKIVNDVRVIEAAGGAAPFDVSAAAAHRRRRRARQHLARTHACSARILRLEISPCRRNRACVGVPGSANKKNLGGDRSAIPIIPLDLFCSTLDVRHHTCCRPAPEGSCRRGRAVRWAVRRVPRSCPSGLAGAKPACHLFAVPSREPEHQLSPRPKALFHSAISPTRRPGAIT